MNGRYLFGAGVFALGFAGALLAPRAGPGARRLVRTELARPSGERDPVAAGPETQAAGSDRAMARIPAGTYEPFYKRAGGAPLRVKPFLLDREPATRADFLEFVERTPRWRRSAVKALFAEASYLTDWQSDLDPGRLPLRAPVTFVSWFAAKAYCEYRGKRLPTVTEWERTAGTAAAEAGGSPFRFAMGRAAPELANHVVFEAIWEWTQDYNSVLVAGKSDDGPGSSLFCGDGYRANDARNYGGFLRFSFRSSLKANYALENLGFRCARSVS